MKKLLFILAISWIIYPCKISASPFPPEGEHPVILVEVNKTNGGILAIFNLYKDVNFSVAGTSGDMIIAHLDCSGAGFSRCEAPRNIVRTNHSLNSTENFFHSEVFYNTINSFIILSEKAFEKGIHSGMETQKISVVDNKISQLYICTATWQYDKKGNGTVSIKVYKNLFPMTIRV